MDRIARDFVNRYSPAYFVGENDPDGVYISKKTCRKNEGKIMAILDKKHEWKPIDVYNLLAWKVGKILYQCTCCCYRANDEFLYARDWQHTEDFTPSILGNEIDLKVFAHTIISDINNNGLREMATNNPQACLEHLSKIAPCFSNGGDKLHSIYLVTLLFFLSGGYWPIFDSKAAKGLMRYSRLRNHDIWSNRRNPPSLPKTESNEFLNLFQANSHYQEYINGLISEFGYEWRNNRDVDRALWVYGHDVPARCCCC